MRRLTVLPLAAVLAFAALSAAPGQQKNKPNVPPPKGTGGVAVFEVYQDRGGDWRFRLKSGDTLLATSGKGYDTKAACQAVIQTIKAEAAKAPVKELPKEGKDAQ